MKIEADVDGQHPGQLERGEISGRGDTRTGCLVRNIDST